MFAVNADSSINMRNSAGIYGVQIGGVAKGTVMLGVTPSSVTSNDIMYYASAGNVNGSVYLFDGTASATTNTILRVNNTNTSDATASARIQAVVGGPNSGDPVISLTVSAIQDWSLGVDNSDSDKFKISSASGPGTNDRLVIDTTGLVGINSSSPSTQLAVKGSGTVDPFDVSSSSGSSILRVTSGGNVGIGTVSPNTKLYVSGSGSTGITVENTDNNNSSILFRRNGSNSGYVGNISSVFGLFNSSGANTLSVVGANDNIGIGTTTPLTKLAVVGTAGANDIFDLASLTSSSSFFVPVFSTLL
jgi:hypothetical protein